MFFWPPIRITRVEVRSVQGEPSVEMRESPARTMRLRLANLLRIKTGDIEYGYARYGASK
jgi:hypothetical protein